MDASTPIYQRFKPHGFWGILKDKSLLIVAGLIGAGVGFVVLWLLNWSGLGVATGMVGIALVIEIFRLRNERRWHLYKIENLERQLKNRSEEAPSK